jgi:hypothetical protein
MSNNPHAPEFIRKSASFFTDRSVDSDMKPFTNRKKSDNGMFYNADGAGTSSASQQPVDDAEKTEAPLELVEEPHQDKYAQIYESEMQKQARLGFLARPSAGKMGRAALLGLGVGGAGLAAAGAESTGRLTGEVQGRLDQAERQMADMADLATSEAEEHDNIREGALADLAETQGAMDRIKGRGLGGLFSRETFDEGIRGAAGLHRAGEAAAGIPEQTRRAVEAHEAHVAARQGMDTALRARSDQSLFKGSSDMNKIANLRKLLALGAGGLAGGAGLAATGAKVVQPMSEELSREEALRAAEAAEKPQRLATVRDL